MNLFEKQFETGTKLTSFPEVPTGVSSEEAKEFASTGHIQQLISYANYLVDLRARRSSRYNDAEVDNTNQHSLQKLAKKEKIYGEVAKLKMLLKEAEWLDLVTQNSRLVSTVGELDTYLKVATHYEDLHSAITPKIEGLVENGFTGTSKHVGDREWLFEVAQNVAGDDEEKIKEVGAIFRDTPGFVQRRLRKQIGIEVGLVGSSASEHTMLAYIIQNNSPERDNPLWFTSKLLEHFAIGDKETAEIDKSNIEHEVVNKLTSTPPDSSTYDLYAEYLKSTSTPEMKKGETYSYSKAMVKTMLNLLEETQSTNTNARLMFEYLEKAAAENATRYMKFNPETRFTRLPVRAIILLANSVTTSINTARQNETPLELLDDSFGDAMVEGCDRIVEAVKLSLENANFSDEKISSIIGCYEAISERQKIFYATKMQNEGTVFSDAEGKEGPVTTIRGKKREYWQRRQPGKGIIS